MCDCQMLINFNKSEDCCDYSTFGNKIYCHYYNSIPDILSTTIENKAI